MPRANRYIQTGCLYHLTHRCHDRQFLFRFALVRNEYRNRLREALKTFNISTLAYCVTSNHTHLLVEARTPRAISRMMQKLEGEFAEWYNRRQRRSGAFWGDRYHCTMVDGGDYAWNCMKYIDLNMVRANVVVHPARWRWCGYDELIGKRQRYRLLDLECVLKWQNGIKQSVFMREYEKAILRDIEMRELDRKAFWTESIAVGSQQFIQGVCDRIRYRVDLEQKEVSEGVWTVREAPVAYT